MGQKPTGPAGDFNAAVVRAIEEARGDMTKAQLIEDSGVPSNTFHTKMRGEKPFNTNEIDRIARALGREPLLMLQEAAASQDGGGAEVTPIRPNVGGSAESRRPGIGAAAHKTPKRSKPKPSVEENVP